MPNRGGFNSRTGKTTPRNKVKTHWKAKGPVKRSSASSKPAKPAAAAATR